MVKTPQSITPIFDTKRRNQKWLRAQNRNADHGERPFLLHEADEGIADRLFPVSRHFSRGLHIGPRSPEWSGYATEWQQGYFDEAEALQAEGVFDLILCLPELHAISDLPGALAQIRSHLAPDGLFLAALFGGDTLQELRTCLTEAESLILGSALHRIPPFAEVPDLGRLLQRTHFTMPIADSERTTVKYRALDKLVRDLRDMGETGPLATTTPPLTRTVWTATQALYSAGFQTDGCFIATFDIVYLTGWAPPTHAGRPTGAHPPKGQTRTIIRTAQKPTK